MPHWNAAQTESREFSIAPELPPSTSLYPSYTPALNRAGWYRYLFLELVGEPEMLEKMLSAFCGETYKPNALNQPDLQKRDGSDPQGLAARANTLRTGAITRVAHGL